MIEKNFKADILPPQNSTKSSNTFVLTAIGGAISLLILFAVVMSFSPNQSIIMWIALALYLATIIFMASQQSNDEPVAAQIGDMFILTESYIAIVNNSQIEKFELNKASPIFFSSIYERNRDNLSGYTWWHCRFNVIGSNYNFYFKTDKHEMLQSMCSELKKQGFRITCSEGL